MSRMAVWIVLQFGFVDRSYTPSDIAAIVYRLRLETARALLDRWARGGATHVRLDASRRDEGHGHLVAVKLAPEAVQGAEWGVRSAEARQLLVASLAAGAIYPEANDPIGAGEGFERRVRVLREALGELADRARVTR